MSTHALHPPVLQPLLTALVAQHTHLILRTPDPDIPLVASLIASILSSVFGYSTRKLRIRHKSCPPSTDRFLNSLFVPAPSSASTSNYTSQDESSDANGPRILKSRHSRTLKQLPLPRQPAPLHVDPAHLSSVSTKSPNSHHVSPNAPITIYPETRLHHHCSSRNNLHTGNSSLPQFPGALVISGLENASLSSQRALARVLAEDRILFDTRLDARTNQNGQPDPDPDEYEGTWDLPPGFILVYICPIDPRERPNIHHSLLDKFAISSNVFLKPAVRHAIQSIPLSPAIARTNSGTHSSPSTPLANSHMSLPPIHPPARPPPVPHHRQSYHPSDHSHSHSHSASHLPGLVSPVLPSNFIRNLQQACTKTHLSPTLTLYLADLFTATRHHPELDGTLLTARCVHDAERLARAARVIGVDPTGLELLRGEEEADDEISGEQWQTVEDEYENIRVASRDSARSIRHDPTDPQTQQTSKDSEAGLDVTEVNIARMFPRCVSHRLRVRDGPREEVLAGAVFGATFGDLSTDEFSTEDVSADAYEVRPTVKDILVSIMSEV